MKYLRSFLIWGMVLVCLALLLWLIPPALAQDDAPPDGVVLVDETVQTGDDILPLPTDSGVFISHEALNAVVVIVGGFMTLISLLIVALYNSSPPSAQRFFTPVLDVFKDVLLALKDRIPGPIDDAIIDKIVERLEAIQSQRGKEETPDPTT